MGEAYRGLTIRLGANVTDFKKALQSSNSAISQTQKQLRQLQQAARLDPDSMGTFNTRLNVTRDNAQAVATKLSLMREEVKQLKASGKMPLAEELQNAALKAKYANDEYNRLNDTIRKLKNTVAFRAGFDDTYFQDIEGYEASVAEMKKLGATTKELAEYEKLYYQWKRASVNLERSKEISDIQNLQVELTATEAKARGVYTEMARMASQFPAITLTKEFKELRNTMEHVEQSAEELRNEFKVLDDALRLDPSDIETARLKMANMQEQVRTNITAMQALNKQMDAMKSTGIEKAVAGVENLTLETKQAEDEVARLSQEFDEAKARLSALTRSGENLDEHTEEFNRLNVEVQEYSAALNEAKARLNTLGEVRVFQEMRTDMARVSAETTELLGQMTKAESRFAGMAGSMQQLGWSMYSTLTPMVTMFAYSAITSAEEVDTAYRNMRKTVQGTEEQFEAMRQEALDFSRTSIVSADTLLQIEAMGGQLGIATSKLEDFAITCANLDIATDLDADTISEQLGQLQGILNDMTEDDFTRFGDALTRLGNNNATLESHISDVMLRISSMGTITGFTTPQLLAWSTAVAATGQGAEAAGTAISKTMSDIEGAVGAGGEVLEAFASTAQMSASQFTESWNTDPSGTMYAFIQGLKDIEANGGSADATLETMGITSVRQKQAILGLMQTIDGLNDNITMSENAWNGVSDQWGEAGDAANEAAKKAEGFSGIIQMLRNNIQVFGVEVGESLTGELKVLADVVASVTQAYSDLPEAGKDVLNYFALFLAALGPVTVATQAVTRVGGNMLENLANKGAWAQIVKGSRETTDGLTGMAAAAMSADDRTKELNKQYKNMTTSQKLATAGQVALNSALKTAGFAAAGAAVYVLVTQLKAAHDRAVDFRDATSGLAFSLGSGTTAAKQQADAFASLAAGAAGAKYDVDELITSQAELSRSIRERNQETEINVAMLDQYSAAISDLAGRSDLSASDVAKLQMAVDAVNEACGTSYEVVQDGGGAYQVMADGAVQATDAIKRLIEVQQLQMQAEVAAQNYKEVYAQQIKDTEALAAAKAELVNAQRAYDEAAARGDANLNSYAQAVVNAQNKVDKLTQATSSASTAATRYAQQQQLLNMAKEDGAGAATKLIAADTELMASLQYLGIDVVALAQKLDATGYSIEELSEMGIEEFAALAEGCDDSTSKILGSLNSINDFKIDDKSFKITVTDWASSTLKTVNSLLGSISSGIAIPITTNAAGGYRLNAAGGYRYHADGAYIATRAMVLPPRDVVGEAGAEAIVPLTNRRYAQPFIDLLTDGVLDGINELIERNRATNTQKVIKVEMPDALTKADVYSAFVSALATMPDKNINLYIAGKHITDVVYRDMELQAAGYEGR